MAKEVVPSEVQATLDQLAVHAANVLVVDDQQLAVATEILTRLSALKAEVETARTALVKPLNDHVKGINAAFKQRSDRIQALTFQLKNQIVQFHQDREKKASEAQAKLDLEAAEKAPKAEDSVSVEIERPKTASYVTGGSAQVKKRWTYEVIDFEKVPDGFKELAKAQVQSAIRGGARDIPGLRIYQTADVSVTRNRD